MSRQWPGLWFDERPVSIISSIVRAVTDYRHAAHGHVGAESTGLISHLGELLIVKPSIRMLREP